MEVREDILRILEIPKILAEFASCVRGELGLSAIEKLRPRGDAKALAEKFCQGFFMGRSFWLAANRLVVECK